MRFNTHNPPGYLLTLSLVAVIAGTVFTQARIALRPEPMRMFSFEMRTIVFGYGHAVCGDGVREDDEECDDGDTSAGDGCSASCTVESGWQCSGVEPDVCTEVCGNGIITSGENCDDGNTSNGDGCSAVCAEESGWSCGDEPSMCETTCGDGIKAGGEACDDGNEENTDACLNTCILPSCGDGFIQEGETCDDSGESADCDLDCTAVVCGDQRVNVTAGEGCDDGNDSNNDACINTCQIAICGDTHVRAGVEQCEPSGGGTCASNCTFATGIGQSFSELEPLPVVRSGPPPNCGNGVLEPEKGESCDAGRFNGLSPACDRWCGLSFCGDGRVHPESEECEPEQDPNGVYMIRTCGSKTCTLPVCMDDGTCIGGCRWVFLPACQSAPVQASRSSVFSSSSSSSELFFTPASSLSSSSSSSSASSVSSAASSASPSAAVSSAASSSSRVPVCGNRILEQGEECDEGPGNSNIAPDSCRLDCFFARCGDGVIDNGEQCDDANNVLGDGCTPLCTLSTCGNGVLEHGEECDEGAGNTNTLSDSCSLSCLLPRCGDGVTDAAFGEVCDDGTGNSNTVSGACRLNCLPPRCGDGTVDLGEQCDDANLNDRDACSNTCTASICGNGNLEWNEACDDGNTFSGDGCSNSCLDESRSFLEWFREMKRTLFGW